MKKSYLKILTSILIILPLLLLSNMANAAGSPFRWVVQNATTNPISGIVGSSNNSTWEAVLMTSKLWAENQRLKEPQDTIQLRLLDSLKPTRETPDEPMSHYLDSQTLFNYWSAHIFYEGKEYYALTKECYIKPMDAKILNQNGQHITVRIYESALDKSKLSHMDVILPSRYCTMPFIQVS